MSIFWFNTDTKPEQNGTYLVAVETDQGCEVETLFWNGKHWIHEGEPTFCHGYFFRPYAWAPRMDAPDRRLFRDDGDEE